MVKLSGKQASFQAAVESQRFAGGPNDVLGKAQIRTEAL